MCAAAALLAGLISCGPLPGDTTYPNLGLGAFVDGAIAASDSEIVTDEDYQSLRLWAWSGSERPLGTWTPMVRAEQNRHNGTLDCAAADARLIYDPQVGRYFDFTLGGTAAGYQGYCIGVGLGTTTDVWLWNAIPWSDQPQDGARIAASDSYISLVSVGETVPDALPREYDRYWLCNKTMLMTKAANACTEFSSPPSIRNRVNVVGADGSTGPRSYILGGHTADVSDASLQAQLVLFDTTYGGQVDVQSGRLDAGTFVQRIYGQPTITWNYPLLKDVVLDRAHGGFGILWAAFVGRCPVSGAHACVGAYKIQMGPTPTVIGRVWFDGPYQGNWDETQPTLTVDRQGNVLMGWLLTGPNTPTSHAVGGFSGALMGENVVRSWRVVAGGTGTAVARYDILQQTMLPGTDLAVSRGVYITAGGQVASSVVFFGANCDPVTGKCR